MTMQLFMSISLNTAVFSTQNGVMPFGSNFPSFLIFTAWLGLSYWDIARLVLQNGILLASKYLRDRFLTLFNKIRSIMTGITKMKESRERTISSPSDLQSGIVGIPLGGAIGVTSHKHSLRHRTKQKSSTLLSRKGVSGYHSVSGDIEMGTLEPQSRAV